MCIGGGTFIPSTISMSPKDVLTKGAGKIAIGAQVRSYHHLHLHTRSILCGPLASRVKFQVMSNQYYCVVCSAGRRSNRRPSALGSSTYSVLVRVSRIKLHDLVLGLLVHDSMALPTIVPDRSHSIEHAACRRSSAQDLRILSRPELVPFPASVTTLQLSESRRVAVTLGIGTTTPCCDNSDIPSLRMNGCQFAQYLLHAVPSTP